jgi:hypothetical protein
VAPTSGWRRGATAGHQVSLYGAVCGDTDPHRATAVGFTACRVRDDSRCPYHRVTCAEERTESLRDSAGTSPCSFVFGDRDPSISLPSNKPGGA